MTITKLQELKQGIGGANPNLKYNTYVDSVNPLVRTTNSLIEEIGNKGATLEQAVKDVESLTEKVTNLESSMDDQAGIPDNPNELI